MLMLVLGGKVLKYKLRYSSLWDSPKTESQVDALMFNRIVYHGTAFFNTIISGDIGSHIL